MLTGAQFGFRKGRSTEHAFHSLARDIHNDMNDGKFVMGIFLDPKKARIPAQLSSEDGHFLFKCLKKIFGDISVAKIYAWRNTPRNLTKKAAHLSSLASRDCLFFK